MSNTERGSEELQGHTQQQELDEGSPSWVARKLADEETPPEWSDIDSYTVRSPFEDPKWVRANGWKKWHAERDCGAETVYLIEDPTHHFTDDQHRCWKLYCARCGAVRWDEVLFLNYDWYVSQFDEGKLDRRFSTPFDRLWLHQPFILETGGAPSSEETRDLIRRSWYESEAQTRMAPPMPWDREVPQEDLAE